MGYIIANIKHFIKRTKHFLAREDVFMSLLVIVVAVSSFFLGVRSISPQEQKPVFTFSDIDEQTKKALSENENNGNLNLHEQASGKGTAIFGSKNGRKYYFSWCSGASRVKLENRVYYASEQEAQQSGRSIAAGCN